MNKIKYKSVLGLEPQSKTILTHMITHDGWQKCNITLENVIQIVYLGKCKHEGDLFAVYYDAPNTIRIWKGIKGEEF